MSVLVKVPGRFQADAAFLDIETRKVPATTPPSEGFRMKNGELLRNRWQAFLVGIARDGHVAILNNPDEKLLLREVRSELYWHAGPIVYSATRQFDEMILKGRFTNARRAHEDRPFYPAMFRADDYEWVCHPHDERLPRGDDLPSKGISRVWEDPTRRIGVLVHNLRDVAELIVLHGDPDPECRIWCRAILASYDFAAECLRHSEPYRAKVQ